MPWKSSQNGWVFGLLETNNGIFKYFNRCKVPALLRRCKELLLWRQLGLAFYFTAVTCCSFCTLSSANPPNSPPFALWYHSVRVQCWPKCQYPHCLSKQKPVQSSSQLSMHDSPLRPASTKITCLALQNSKVTDEDGRLLSNQSKLWLMQFHLLPR